MKTDYSVECEECKMYNISPIKCEDCWKKEVGKVIDDWEKGLLDYHATEEDIKELKQKLGIK